LGCLGKAIFGRQRGLIRDLLELNFAFDAEQLRGILPVPFRTHAVGRHRVVNRKPRRAALSRQALMRERLQILHMRGAPGPTTHLERIAQHQQALREFAAFD
jgi:hypothetical protein